MTATEMVHVAYKGAAPAVTELLGGQVQLMFNPMPPLLPHVKSGKLRALAVGSTQRSSAVPDVPTVAEAGVPGYEYVTWYALFAPAKTPSNVISVINTSVAGVLGNAEIAQRLSSQGAEPRAVHLANSQLSCRMITSALERSFGPRASRVIDYGNVARIHGTTRRRCMQRSSAARMAQ